jgi:hypothetical protein
MKKIVWVIIVLIPVLGIFPLTSQAAPLKNLSWRAEYYDNPTLSGQPKLSRFEDVIDHDWGSGAPTQDLPSDNFSARWSVTRHFDQGTYLLILTVDDGARVWFDGQLVLDAWSLGRKANRKARVYVGQSGNHQLQVAYFEKTGRATIKFDLIQLASQDEVVGSWRGEYFINRDLAGEPTIIRRDGAINFDWNSGAPDLRITRDNFSVRWTRLIYLEAGTYQLRIQHDDGMRIFVNDENIYDSWHDQGVTYQTRQVRLDQGNHAFRVEYYDHLGNAVAHMTIDGDPGRYDDTDGDGGDDGTVPGDKVIVDNKSSDFDWGGPLSNRFASAGGYGTGFYWTYNTTSVPVNFGKWTPDLASGDYEVFAYIPGQHATTRSARYRIQHNGVRSDRVVNQNIYSNTWISLGTYHFDGAGQEYVALYDNTSEVAGSTQIAFDAIKFVKR